MMMQFACTARAADDEDYRPLAETPLTLDFAYDHGVSTLADPAVWQVTLTNNADAPWRGVVKLEHCVAYDAPRFFLPGFLYGRNRGEAPIRVDNRYPRLRAGTPEFPASPWWMVRADRLSHPAAFLLDGGRWYGLSAAPYFVRQNGVLQPWQPGRAGTFAQFAGFTCSLDTGSVGYTLGYENAPWLFVQSHNIKPRAPMGENCLTLAAGESVAFPLYLYDFVAVDGERTLYAALEAVYGLWHTPPRPGTTPSHAAELLAGAVTRDAWLPDDKNYVGITKERSDGSYEQNKIFSISWTNGLSAAVPCLQAAHRLGDETIRAAALACIDNIVQNSLDPRCGLPNETWDAENGWSCRGWWFDGMYTGGHSGYLVGQTLYYILKAYRLEECTSLRSMAGRSAVSPVSCISAASAAKHQALPRESYSNPAPVCSLNSATMCPYRSRRCPASAGRAAAAASLRWPTRTFTPCPAQLPTRCSTICAAAPMPILNPV